MAEFGWYPKDVPAYRADTRHLSCLEHGAYGLLLDEYYLTRRPLPDNDRALANICLLPLADWLAIAPTIRAFFRLKGDALHQKKADKVLDAQDLRARNRSESAQKAAVIRHSKNKELDAGRMPDACATPADAMRGDARGTGTGRKKVDPPSGEGPAAPSPSPEEIFATFNEVAARIGLPIAAKLTPQRRSQINARLKEHGGHGWQRAFDKLVESPFLRGENDRHWRADIDFVVRPGKFTKLIEGGYDRHGAAQSDMLAAVLTQVSEEIDNGIGADVQNGQRAHSRPNGAYLEPPATPTGQGAARSLDENVHSGHRRAKPDRG